jgi:hypothetical protein
MTPDEQQSSRADFEPFERGQLRDVLDDFHYQKKRRADEAQHKAARREQWKAWIAIPGAAIALWTFLTTNFPHLLDWLGRAPPRGPP